jgi:hypothetical protein
MSERHHRTGFILASAALMLVGCAPGGVETSSPRPIGSSTNAPTPLPSGSAPSVPGGDDVATVTVSGSRFVLLGADDSIIEEFAFEVDPGLALDALTDAFDESPAMSEIPGDDTCQHAATVATWGEGFELRYETGGLPAGQQFYLVVSTPAVGSVSVETPQGVSVGDSVDELRGSYPAAHTATEEANGSQYVFVDYDVVEGAPVDWKSEERDDLYWGAMAKAVDGVVTRLVSPTHLFDWC